MKLSLLFETKPYSEMSPPEKKKARTYRREKYQRDRETKGRNASGSNETNKQTTKKWREENPDKATQVNKVNHRVRTGDLPQVKDGKQRHHISYKGGNGGKFLSINGATNARKANKKRELS